MRVFAAKKTNGTPAFRLRYATARRVAGVTVLFERELSIINIVMPAQAGIPFSFCFVNKREGFL